MGMSYPAMPEDPLVTHGGQLPKKGKVITAAMYASATTSCGPKPVIQPFQVDVAPPMPSECLAVTLRTVSGRDRPSAYNVCRVTREDGVATASAHRDSPLQPQLQSWPCS